MRRLTLGDMKSSVAEVLGGCSTDAKVALRLNEAQERLLNRPMNPVGSWCRYRVCVSDSCVILPRQVRTVLAFWVCSCPGTFVSEMHEMASYDEGGYGLLDGDSGMCGTLLLDRGVACCHANVTSATTVAPKKIQAVASDTSDNGKKITLRYVKADGNRQYTSIGGVVQEGEELTLSTAGVLTSATVKTGGLYHVVKGVTNHPVRLYSYNTVTATQWRLMALYEPSETLPIYRRMLLPGIEDVSGCASGQDSDDPKAVTMLVRLQHIPVVVDNDPLVINNAPALLDMVTAIKLRRERNFPEAAVMEAQAATELDGELAAYYGDGMRIRMRVEDRNVWGPGLMSHI